MLVLINGAASGLTLAVSKTEVSMGAFADVWSWGLHSHGEIGCLTHIAARRGMVGALEFLLKNGSDPTTIDSTGKTSLEIAREAGMGEACSFIEKFLADRDANKSKDEPFFVGNRGVSKTRSSRDTDTCITVERVSEGSSGGGENGPNTASMQRWIRLRSLAHSVVWWATRSGSISGKRRSKVGIEPLDSSSSPFIVGSQPLRSIEQLLPPLSVSKSSSSKTPSHPEDSYSLSSLSMMKARNNQKREGRHAEGSVVPLLAVGPGLSEELRKHRGEVEVVPGASCHHRAPDTFSGDSLLCGGNAIGKGSAGGVMAVHENRAVTNKQSRRSSYGSMRRGRAEGGKKVEVENEEEKKTSRGVDPCNASRDDVICQQAVKSLSVRAAATTGAGSPISRKERTKDRGGGNMAKDFQGPEISSIYGQIHGSPSEKRGETLSSIFGQTHGLPPEKRRKGRSPSCFVREPENVTVTGTETRGALPTGRVTRSRSPSVMLFKKPAALSRTTKVRKGGSASVCSTTQAALNIIWALRRLRPLKTPRERREAFSNLRESSPFYIPPMYFLPFVEMAAFGEIPRLTGSRYLGHGSKRPMTCSQLVKRAAQRDDDPFVVYISHKWLEPDFKHADNHAKIRFYQARLDI